ncbi:ParA family protein [Halomonas sp.]|uniref:ParA family protein n=2 Tax=Oceanospirillales TaxID=135619 RepID=UPI003F932BA2
MGMGKIIVVGNQKGGVGKTAISVNLAFYLNRLGYKVLVVDGDAQGNSTETLTKTPEGIPLELYGHTYADLFGSVIDDVKVMKLPRGIDLLHTPSNDALLSEKMQLTLDEATMPQRNLRKLFAAYDYVVMDSPPSLGSVLFSLLVMADHVFIPVRVSSFASTGAAGLLQTAIGIQREHNPRLKISGIVINFFKPTSIENQRSYEFLKQELGDMLLTNIINDRTPIDTAIEYGVPIKELNYAHVAAREVDAVLAEMMERVS